MSKFDRKPDDPNAAPDRTGRRVQDVLKFKPAGSVEDAKKAMLAAGQQPGGPNAKLRAVDSLGGVEAEELPVVAVPVVVAPVVEGEFEEEIEEVPPAAKPAVIAPAPVQPQKIERVENAQFVAEIKQDNGKWVGEIRYKNGQGAEKFTADTKNQLMVKLLEGKGHATLRVNKAVRREKFGFSELDRQYPLPDNITVKDFEEMSDGQQDHLLQTVATEQALRFREAHPEFHRTSENTKKLSDFLGKEKLPITARNLEYALDELSDPNLPAEVRLAEKPGAVSPAPVVLETALETPPARTDPAPAVIAPVVAPAATPALAPGVTVRKRGTTGLRPGDSSVETAPGAPEGGHESREPSEAELRKMPLTELRRIARSEWKQPNRV